MPPVARICVFCGANPGLRPAYAEAARELGRELARARIELVFGGGRVGLMGVIADATLAAGGRAIGVIPRSLVLREVAHEGLSEQHVVESMHERKALMVRLSDAFVALPGGFGTFDELCEVLTWAQLGFHAKPIALLNVGAYFDPLLAMFDRAVLDGFVQAPMRALVREGRSPAEILSMLAGTREPIRGG